MKYIIPEMNLISVKQDILTASPIKVAGTNEETGWGSLNFGGAKNSPLADLANSIASKF